VKRKVIGLVAAVVLALAGTFAIVAYVNGAEERALAGEDIVKVLVVKEQIPAGTPASELGDRVGLEQVAAKVQAEGAVSSVKTLGDEITSATLVPGEQLVEKRFVAPSDFTARGAAVEVPDGMLQTTVALDPERAVGGKIVPGSTVAVTVNTSAEPYETHMILQKVLVTNVQLETRGPSAETDDADTDSSGVEPGEAPTGRLLITLALDAASSERVIFGAQHGTVWLSLQPRTAGEGGTRIIYAGNIFQ